MLKQGGRPIQWVPSFLSGEDPKDMRCLLMRRGQVQHPQACAGPPGAEVFDRSTLLPRRSLARPTL
eukprot:2715068-Pyramimonas_sp.AAC.1